MTVILGELVRAVRDELLWLSNPTVPDTLAFRDLVGVEFVVWWQTSLDRPPFLAAGVVQVWDADDVRRELAAIELGG